LTKITSAEAIRAQKIVRKWFARRIIVKWRRLTQDWIQSPHTSKQKNKKQTLEGNN